jgi:structural maintenance of chromosome 1
MEQNARDINTKNKALAGLREDHRVRDGELEKTRAEQAKARAAVTQKEKRVKKMEKALEARVRCYLNPSNTTIKDLADRNQTLLP